MSVNKSCFVHCPGCSSVPKTRQQDLTKDPEFRTLALFARGKAPLTQLAAKTQMLGRGGLQVSSRTLWRARAAVEAEHSSVYEQKFEALPMYLDSVVENNAGSFYRIETSEGNTFRAAFLTLMPVAQLLSWCMRKVSGTDFGHSANINFEGVYAMGMFQTGNGLLIPLWLAVFGGVGKNEDGYNWQFCAECCKDAGLEDLYDGTTHFHDRSKGAPFFDSALKTLISLWCGRHIMKNARDAAPVNEKTFHENMFWVVQGSETEADSG